MNRTHHRCSYSQSVHELYRWTTKDLDDLEAFYWMRSRR
jgi:hypothetical protein